jgi:hypothetical protein
MIERTVDESLNKPESAEVINVVVFSSFTGVDFAFFFLPVCLGLLVFTRRRRHKAASINCLLLWLVLIVGASSAICQSVYTTYSYRDHMLYNNAHLTTVFNIDFAEIVFCMISLGVSSVLFYQELQLRKHRECENRSRMSRPDAKQNSEK